jgi:cytochrome c-type biogenesis protein CcmH/NrfF
MGTWNRLVAWTAVIVATMAMLIVASVDDGTLETDAERIQRLSDSFACPQCQGEDGATARVFDSAVGG